MTADLRDTAVGVYRAALGERTRELKDWLLEGLRGELSAEPLRFRRRALGLAEKAAEGALRGLEASALRAFEGGLDLRGLGALQGAAGQLGTEAFRDLLRVLAEKHLDAVIEVLVDEQSTEGMKHIRKSRHHNPPLASRYPEDLARQLRNEVRAFEQAAAVERQARGGDTPYAEGSRNRSEEAQICWRFLDWFNGLASRRRRSAGGESPHGRPRKPATSFVHRVSTLDWKAEGSERRQTVGRLMEAFFFEFRVSNKAVGERERAFLDYSEVGQSRARLWLAKHVLDEVLGPRRPGALPPKLAEKMQRFAEQAMAVSCPPK